ncbi:D-ornithine 4,5-aminomutase subunit OraS [Micromonospora sp. NPDC048843]|uniref:D-ornithine 4,5-aminomutase subunit OraS n=1 Tax=Micromonospora sp. NPDC048843 TaxID=3155389 RepID=UPI00340EC2B2
MDDERTRLISDRLEELAALPDEAIRDRFRQLCDDVVAPLIGLARTHTSPSIERSVLLRMGVDSVTARDVVAKIVEAGLLDRGAEHVLRRVAERSGTDVRTAAGHLLTNPGVLTGLFAGDGRR